MSTWWSQGGQDRWVHSIVGEVGYFVDVGAYDGIETSNTYALELAGWDGVCIEANPNQAEVCAHNRACRTVHCAVTSRSGMVRFYGDRIVDSGGDEIVAATLTTILDQVGAPPVFDYLSLDIEGGELDALRGLDFERYRPRLLTVEHNLYAEGPMRKQLIFDFLTALGYTREVEDARCLDERYPQYYGQPYEDWYVTTQS